MAQGDVITKISKQSGKSLYFDGINDSVSIPYNRNLDFDIDEELTVIAWVYVTDDGTTKDIIHAANGSGKYSFRMYLVNAGAVVNLYCARYNGVITNVRVLNVSAYVGKWTMVAITVNSTHLTAYLNDTPSYISNNIQSGTTLGASGNLRIGRHPGNVNPYKGKIDEVRIYGVCATQEEISNIYKNKHYTIKDMRGYWSFNNPTDTGKDTSGNDNNGTTSGAISMGGHNTIEDDAETLRATAGDVWGFVPLAGGQDAMTIHIEEV